MGKSDRARNGCTEGARGERGEGGSVEESKGFKMAGAPSLYWIVGEFNDTLTFLFAYLHTHTRTHTHTHTHSLSLSLFRPLSHKRLY